jgi:DNA-binding HxlR family transcriptional regulator
MSSYGQFCPVAKAMELLDERWTMLVVRELMLGSRHFNDLRRGVPRMSPALLSARLRMLTRAGVVERHEDGRRITYRLTPAGEELQPIVEALGRWGIRWIPDLGDVDLDPHLLLWDIHRNLDLDAVPPGRTVVRFLFPDQAPAAREWWLVIHEREVDVCDHDPGHPVTATLECELRTLVRVWRGDLSWSGVQRSGALAVRAPSRVRAAVPRWFRLSAFATVPRPA